MEPWRCLAQRIRRHCTHTPPVFTAKGMLHSSHSVLKIDFWKIGTGSLAGRSSVSPNLGGVFPCHDVAGANRPAVEHVTEGAAPPGGEHPLS